METEKICLSPLANMANKVSTRTRVVATRRIPNSATHTNPSNKWRRKVHFRRRPTSIKVVKTTSSKSYNSPTLNSPTSLNSRIRMGSLVAEPALLSSSSTAKRIVAGTLNRITTATPMLGSTSNTSQLTRISMVTTMGCRAMTTPTIGLG